MSALKRLSTVMLSAMLVVAGCMHFTHDYEFEKITPLPFALEIVWVTGVMELLFAVMLLVPKYRRATGMLLAFFFLAVLPANINMVVNDIPMFGSHVAPTLLWFRVFMQLPLIIWVLWATGFWNTYSLTKKSTSKTEF